MMNKQPSDVRHAARRSVTRREMLHLGSAGVLGLAVDSLFQVAARSEYGVLVEERADGDDMGAERWWPIQTLPTAVVRTREGPTLAHQMMLQSIAGLAAKAVNRARGRELIWVATGNVDFEAWFADFARQHPQIEVQEQSDPWELVQQYRRQGIIKGYILYSLDRSEGRVNDHRVGMNLSVNVATSLAGLLDGVIIADGLEDEARKHGLEKLVDVRRRSQQWCFDTYRDQFNRRLLSTQDPRKPHLRDLAIAHQALVLYGPAEPIESAMKWLEPLSPIAGWNGGDEFETTKLSSVYGHLQTATDWCMNLPVLMAGSERTSPTSVKNFDPRTINWDDERSSVSFILSDGDNVQWLESSFFHGNTSYWANPERGRIPFGWSCCFSQLAQLCPVAVQHAITTQTPNDQFIEWGGGYYYPDLFGQARSDRDKLLKNHARRTWKLMQRNDVRMLAFNVAKVDSPDTLAALETIAGETDGLTAMLVFQYAPYEGGAGKTFWVKDSRDVEIPVISARYSIWENSNDRARSGTPVKVAREISESVSDKSLRHDWAIVHAWSYFRRDSGDDVDAENIPQEAATLHGGVRGFTPAMWCAERLPGNVRVVTMEEVAWRKRMLHDPAVTKRLVAQFDQWE